GALTTMLCFALSERILQLQTLAPRFSCPFGPLLGVALGLGEVRLQALPRDLRFLFHARLRLAQRTCTLGFETSTPILRLLGIALLRLTLDPLELGLPSVAQRTRVLR